MWDVLLDAQRSVGHALHLRLLLRPQRLLPRTQEEEKGADGGRGGRRRRGGGTVEGSGDGGVTARRAVG